MTTKTAESFTYTDHPGWQHKARTHRILVVAYFNGRPSAVVTNHSTFDFDYCKRDDTLRFRDVGSGMYDRTEYQIGRFVEPDPPPCKIWTAPGIQLTRWESAERPNVPVDDAEALTMGYVRLRRPMLLTATREETRNPFEAGEESDCHTEYCSICDDSLPDDNLCAHIYWGADGCVGAGSEEPAQDAVFAALDWLSAAQGWQDWCVTARNFWRFHDRDNLVKVLESMLLAPEGFVRLSNIGSHHIEDAFAKSAREQSDDWENEDWQKDFQACEYGLGWLTTLGRDTPQANAMTLRWILEWRLSASVRAEANLRKGLISRLSSHAGDADRGKQILALLGIPDGKRADLDTVPVETLQRVLAGLDAETAEPAQ